MTIIVMASKAKKIDWMVFSRANLSLILSLSVCSVSNLAFAHRLGIPATLDVTTKDVYTEALKKGVSFGELIAMPEKVCAACMLRVRCAWMTAQVVRKEALQQGVSFGEEIAMPEKVGAV